MEFYGIAIALHWSGYSLGGNDPLQTGKEAEKVALQFDRLCLCPNAQPLWYCLHDQGPEFGKEFVDLTSSHGIVSVPTKVKNSQANAVLECSNQVVGDMLRTYDFEQLDLGPDDGPDDPLVGYLVVTAFAWCVTHHSCLQASLSKLVFLSQHVFSCALCGQYGIAMTAIAAACELW
jgi:hypothetical protein